MTVLVKYEAARHALEVACKIDEVKAIKNKAAALAFYAIQAKDMELLNYATEIKVRAERRAGELLTAMPKNVGTAGAGKPAKLGGPHNVPPKKATPTLDELGISKNQSSQWQKLAAMPEPQFEQSLAVLQAKEAKLTTKAVLANGQGPPKPAPTPQEAFRYEEASGRLTHLLDVEVAKWPKDRHGDFAFVLRNYVKQCPGMKETT